MTTGNSSTRAFGMSDIGRVRARNEDSFLVAPEHQLYGVADGMGGHQRGDIASSRCIESLRNWFAGKVDREVVNRFARVVQGLRGVRCPEEADAIAAVEYANVEVYRASRTRLEYRGMGTTLVATRFYEDQMFVVYSGDSRLYRYRARRLKQLSVDHSLVNEYIRMHMLKPSDARTFPHRNVLTKAMGLKEAAEIDWFRRRARHGDVYLLCSDGLTDMLTDREISRILANGGTLEERCRRLVHEAVDAGGIDNVTTVLIEVLA
jgi:protein phosphatase